MIDYYRALLRGGGAQRQLGFPVIETPTLMLWGEQDLALSKESSFGTERWVNARSPFEATAQRGGAEVH